MEEPVDKKFFECLIRQGGHEDLIATVLLNQPHLADCAETQPLPHDEDERDDDVVVDAEDCLRGAEVGVHARPKQRYV